MWDFSAVSAYEKTGRAGVAAEFGCLSAWQVMDADAIVRSVECVFSDDIMPAPSPSDAEGPGATPQTPAASKGSRSSPTPGKVTSPPALSVATASRRAAASGRAKLHHALRMLNSPLSPKRIKQRPKVRSLTQNHTAHLRNLGLSSPDRKYEGRAHLIMLHLTNNATCCRYPEIVLTSHSAGAGA